MVVINIPDPNFPLSSEQVKYADVILESLGDFSYQLIDELNRNTDRTL